MIGTRVAVRADRCLVKVFSRGQLVKIHPRQGPGGRSTDPEDLPSDKAVYALRDLDKLQRMAGAQKPTTTTPASGLTWAERLRRVFNIDISTCPHCGGKLRIIADVTNPDVIEKILKHIAARGPPTFSTLLAIDLPF